MGASNLRNQRWDARRKLLWAALDHSSLLVGPNDETTDAHYFDSVELGEEELEREARAYVEASDAWLSRSPDTVDHLKRVGVLPEDWRVINVHDVRRLFATVGRALDGELFNGYDNLYDMMLEVAPEFIPPPHLEIATDAEMEDRRAWSKLVEETLNTNDSGESSSKLETP